MKLPQPQANDACLTADEVRTTLNRVHLTPREFVDLILEACVHSEYGSLCELVHTLGVLRAQHARDCDNFKLLKAPSPVESEYQICLETLQTEKARAERRRVGRMGRILVNTKQATSLRFDCLVTLAGNPSIITVANARQMVDCYLENHFNSAVFNLLVSAMDEEFLSVEDQMLARDKASRMFRSSEPLDFGINVEDHRDKFFVESDEAVFERMFDRLYGNGTYERLTVYYPSTYR